MQRLAILLALGHRPDLLILDEPAASLDSAARRSLLRELLANSREKGQTTLFSTHITSDLERVASHVAVVSGGRVSFYGELDELKDRVKRIHVQSTAPLPMDVTIPGSLDLRIDGNTAVAAVTDTRAKTLDQVAEQLGATITVEDLNLEDILLEMTDA